MSVAAKGCEKIGTKDGRRLAAMSRGAAPRMAHDWETL
jgi:hypothetical protein